MTTSTEASLIYWDLILACTHQSNSFVFKVNVKTKQYENTVHVKNFVVSTEAMKLSTVALE